MSYCNSPVVGGTWSTPAGTPFFNWNGDHFVMLSKASVRREYEAWISQFGELPDTDNLPDVLQAIQIVADMDAVDALDALTTSADLNLNLNDPFASSGPINWADEVEHELFSDEPDVRIIPIEVVGRDIIPPDSSVSSAGSGSVLYTILERGDDGDKHDEQHATVDHANTEDRDDTGKVDSEARIETVGDGEARSSLPISIDVSLNHFNKTHLNVDPSPSQDLSRRRVRFDQDIEINGWIVVDNNVPVADIGPSDYVFVTDADFNDSGDSGVSGVSSASASRRSDRDPIRGILKNADKYKQEEVKIKAPSFWSRLVDAVRNIDYAAYTSFEDVLF